MSTEVFKISVGFALEGKVLDVSAISIAVAPSTIPSVKLVLNPDSRAAVTAINVSSILAQLSRLSVYKGSTNTSLSVKLTPLLAGSTAAEQHINLSGWVVAGVGLEQLTAGGGIRVGLELQHPASLLDVGLPGNAKNTSEGKQPSTPKSIPNLLAAYELALEAWVSDQSAHDVTDEDKKLTQLMKEVIGAIPKHLKYGSTYSLATSAFPLPGITKSGGTPYFRAIYDGVMNSGGTGSTWEQLVSYLLRSTQLTVIPTYDNPQLCVTPFEPWGRLANPVFSVDDLVNIAIDVSDPAPVLGARIRYEGFDSPDISAAWNKAMAAGATSSIIYGSYSKSNDLVLIGKSQGKVIDIRCPEWLQPSMFAAGNASVFPSTANGTWGEYSEQVSPEAQQQDLVAAREARYAVFTKAGKKLAESELLCAYRQNTSISFNTRPMLTDGSNTIYPGHRFKLVDETAASILTFYATTMVHHIDVGEGSAYTSWSGAYVRCDGDNNSYAKDNTANPLYIN